MLRKAALLLFYVSVLCGGVFLALLINGLWIQPHIFIGDIPAASLTSGQMIEQFKNGAKVIEYTTVHAFSPPLRVEGVWLGQAVLFTLPIVLMAAVFLIHRLFFYRATSKSGNHPL